MEWLESINAAVNNVVWGPIMLVLLIGTGIYLSIRCGFLQARKFGYIWKYTFATLFHKEKSEAHKSDGTNVTPFQAVSTALGSTIGVGNVAGVAGAVAAGGPGAVFWMWISAFFGMCTKYAEIVLAVHYREVSPDGTHHGGPMYYIERGLHMKWLACIFAILGGLATFGIGNATQAAEISVAVNNLTGTGYDSSLITGIVLMVLVGIVILGGLHRISTVTSYLVPFMALFYIVIGLGVILGNAAMIPGAFGQIFSGAFSLEAVGGGVFGYVILQAMKNGFARGVFSNEAGLGSAPIAHAASSTKDPVKQGMWGVFEVFVDTIVVCTITGPGGHPLGALHRHPHRRRSDGKGRGDPHRQRLGRPLHPRCPDPLCPVHHFGLGVLRGNLLGLSHQEQQGGAVCLQGHLPDCPGNRRHLFLHIHPGGYLRPVSHVEHRRHPQRPHGHPQPGGSAAPVRRDCEAHQALFQDGLQPGALSKSLPLRAKGRLFRTAVPVGAAISRPRVDEGIDPYRFSRNLSQKPLTVNRLHTLY